MGPLAVRSCLRGSTLLPLDTARQFVIEAAQQVGAERVGLRAAHGRVLAEDICAPGPLPSFDYSAMDGYALRSADLGAGARVPVAGESRAGEAQQALARGAAMRIFTGAPLPQGADCVVPQEQVRRPAEGPNASPAAPPPVAEWIELLEKPAAWEHVRRRGVDAEAGQAVLARGQRLTAFHLGLAAAVDVAELCVRVRPRVALLSTGDELRLPGSPGRAGSVPESNSVAVAALAESAGAQVELCPLPGDDSALGTRLLEEAVLRCDLLVTIGGVSVGRYDWVRDALQAAGVELDFWKLQVKPGKPLAFGRRGRCRVLGLPGNPLSAQITFLLLGLPLLRAMQGQPPRPLPSRTATLAQPIRKGPGRRSFYPATVDGDSVTPLPRQSSGNTTLLAWAQALVDLPADCAGAEPGDRVSLLHLADLCR